ncbi:MAG: hypothetical protein NTW54_04875 [Bacteroidetes bacterium]|nr:hypothetical protein [Bacteroidota bacterium]
MKYKKILFIALWCLLIAGVGVLLFAINQHKRNETCERIDIEIENSESNHFIDSAMVIQQIDANQIIGNKIANIDAGQIETLLESNPHIKNAEFYKEVDGTLHIKIWQRAAMMRVINLDEESYYVDEENNKMPLSKNYTARVLVCNGNLSEKCTKCDTINSNTLKTCACIAQYVHKSSFWNSTIEQIFVTSDSAIILVTKLGDLKIIFGDATELEAKFNRLFAFYKQALSKTGWDKYMSIDVSYKNQLVAKKR